MAKLSNAVDQDEFLLSLGINPNYEEKYHKELRLIVTGDINHEEKESMGHFSIGYVFVHNITHEVCAIAVQERREDEWFDRLVSYDDQSYFSTTDKKEDILSYIEKDRQHRFQTLQEIYSQEPIFADDFSKNGIFYSRFLQYQEDENKKYLNSQDQKHEEILKIYQSDINVRGFDLHFR